MAEQDDNYEYTPAGNKRTMVVSTNSLGPILSPAEREKVMKENDAKIRFAQNVMATQFIEPSDDDWLGMEVVAKAVAEKFSVDASMALTIAKLAGHELREPSTQQDDSGHQRKMKILRLEWMLKMVASTINGEDVEVQEKWEIDDRLEEGGKWIPFKRFRKRINAAFISQVLVALEREHSQLIGLDENQKGADGLEEFKKMLDDALSATKGKSRAGDDDEETESVEVSARVSRKTKKRKQTLEEELLERPEAKRIGATVRATRIDRAEGVIEGEIVE